MTAQKIIHDQLFLRQKSDLAGKNDLQVDHIPICSTKVICQILVIARAAHENFIDTLRGQPV